MFEFGIADQRGADDYIPKPDAQGGGFTDASAWYWAALLGQSQGPWQAITIASPL